MHLVVNLVEQDRNLIMKRYRKLPLIVQKHLDIDEYEKDIKKRMVSRRFVGISKHLMITSEQYLELEKLVTKYNKGVNSLFVRDLLKDSEYRKEYYLDKGLSRDCLDDVDKILKARIGTLKSFLTEGVWFEAYSSDGVLSLVIVDKDKNAKRYEFTSIGKGTYEEFKRKLRQDRLYKGKGYKVLQWLEDLYGKGEKVS